MYLAYPSVQDAFSICRIQPQRMYYLLRMCRTTTELRVFAFVAHVIHLGKVNSLSPFEDYEIPIGIIRLHVGKGTLFRRTHLSETLIFM